MNTENKTPCQAFFRDFLAKTRFFREKSTLIQMQHNLRPFVSRFSRRLGMSDGVHRLTIPDHRRINPYTLKAIIKDASLTDEEFKELLLRHVVRLLTNQISGDRFLVLKEGNLWPGQKSWFKPTRTVASAL
jgi:hypothetical protein